MCDMWNYSSAFTRMWNYNNNGLFDLAARAGLDTQSTCILHIEPKYKKTRKYSPMFSRTQETRYSIILTRKVIHRNSNRYQCCRTCKIPSRSMCKILKRWHKWVFCKDIVTLNKLLIKSGSSLFHKIQSPVHCINLLLPPKRLKIAIANASYPSVILMF